MFRTHPCVAAQKPGLSSVSKLSCACIQSVALAFPPPSPLCRWSSNRDLTKLTPISTCPRVLLPCALVYISLWPAVWSELLGTERSFPAPFQSVCFPTPIPLEKRQRRIPHCQPGRQNRALCSVWVTSFSRPALCVPCVNARYDIEGHHSGRQLGSHIKSGLICLISQPP